MVAVPRLGRRAATLAIAGAAVVALASYALAQGSPFGVGPGPTAPYAPSGFTGWVLAEQARFFKSLSAAIREAKADGTAAWGLIWLSFLYGVFHAAGPGHGKAVISAYLLADGSTIPRGIALSALSAIAQAVTAVVLVGIAALVLGATARAMGEAVRLLELGAYAIIVVFGLTLAWRKGRGLVQVLAVRRDVPSQVAHAHHAGVARDHAGHHHGHVHDEDCGHSHGPEPQELAGKDWLKRGLGAVVAVGLRPCSGAILVLVFALAQGIFWIGVASTFAMAAGTAITVAAIAILAVCARGVAARLASGGNGAALITIRGLEFVASLAIIAVGVLLFTGLLASERMFGV